MTPERIAQLRSKEGGVFVYLERDDEHNYTCCEEEWGEMLDEIERLRALVAGRPETHEFEVGEDVSHLLHKPDWYDEDEVTA